MKMDWEPSREDWIRDLKPHVGHRIVCVQYGEDIALECADCNQALFDTEDLEYEEEGA